MISEEQIALDGAYWERNQLVALLTVLFPAGIAKTRIEGWEPEWHNCVYIDLPTGQVSWHYHDREADLFASLPAYTKPWDGHSTAEKYARVRRLTRSTCPKADLLQIEVDSAQATITVLRRRVDELKAQVENRTN